jgi:hypothetical protein
MSTSAQDLIIKDIDAVHPDFSFLFLDHCIRYLGNQKTDVHDKFIRRYIEKLTRGDDIKRLSMVVQGIFALSMASNS